MKKIFFLSLIVLFLAISCNLKQTTNITTEPRTVPPYDQKLMVGNKILYVEVVATKEKLVLGLSGREKLLESNGMLFNFNSKIKPAFWMKDMKFNLDIIWIRNKKIIGFTENIPTPNSDTKLEELPTYPAPAIIDQVLEIPAGWVNENQIKIGDEITLQN
jgi:uncharacterized protein